MAHFLTIQPVIGNTTRIAPGFKSCPHCGSIDLEYPSSKVSYLPYPTGEPRVYINHDQFTGYTSWFCLQCNLGFAVPSFIPDDPNMRPETPGSIDAGF